jgi:hypothetical protein
VACNRAARWLVSVEATDIATGRADVIVTFRDVLGVVLLVATRGRDSAWFRREVGCR